MVTKIILDPHAGEVAIGRVYGGKIQRGQEVYVVIGEWIRDILTKRYFWEKVGDGMHWIGGMCL